MTVTAVIGAAGNKVIALIVGLLVALHVHPNVLTFAGLLINIAAATLISKGSFKAAGFVILGAALFDMLDGRVARQSNKVSRFGAFFDSVIDRYSDLALLVGLLVYYASINRNFYVVLTAVVMAASVMVSYTRARAECFIPQCKAGFMERPERIVLIIIGCLFDRMAPVLWVIALLGNLTVVQRIVLSWQELRRLEEAQLRASTTPNEALR